MIKSKFDFYDIVKVSSNKETLKDFNGRECIIMGVSQNEENPRIFSYAVSSLNENGEIEWSKIIYEEDLQATGRKTDRSKIYTGESVRVRVDPETGEGYLVDED